MKYLPRIFIFGLFSLVVAWISLIVFGIFFTPGISVDDLPNPPVRSAGIFNNPENLMDAAEARAIDARLIAFQKETGIGIAVVVVDSLKGGEVFYFSDEVFQFWENELPGEFITRLILVLIEKNDLDWFLRDSHEDESLHALVRGSTSVLYMQGEKLQGLDELLNLLLVYLRETDKPTAFEAVELAGRNLEEHPDVDLDFDADVDEVVDEVPLPPVSEEYEHGQDGLAARPDYTWNKFLFILSLFILALLLLYTNGHFSSGANFERRYFKAVPFYDPLRWAAVPAFALVILAGLYFDQQQKIYFLLYPVSAYFLGKVWRRSAEYFVSLPGHPREQLALLKKQEDSVPFACLVLGFLFPFTSHAIWLEQAIKRLRKAPLNCPVDGEPLRKISSRDETSFLSLEQAMEEDLKSVDHEVWFCDIHQHVEIYSNEKKKSQYSTCPQCGRRTLLRTKYATVTPATTAKPGLAKREADCRNCDYERTDEYVLARLKPASEKMVDGILKENGDDNPGDGETPPRMVDGIPVKE